MNVVYHYHSNFLKVRFGVLDIPYNRCFADYRAIRCVQLDNRILYNSR